MSNIIQDSPDGILAVTIDCPDTHNSLDKNLRLELGATFERVQEPDMRAVILLGGSKAFCTDRDSREHTSDLQSGASMGKAVEEYNPMVTELIVISVPVIAAIEGAAAGAGWPLTLHCDPRIAGPKVSFKTAFPSTGLVTGCGMSALLPRMVSDAKVRELLLFDKKVLADEALNLGLVTEIMDDPATWVRELIVRFAVGPTAALKEIKALLRRDTSAATAAEVDARARLAASADHKEAVVVFLEKQPPHFVGE